MHTLCSTHRFRFVLTILQQHTSEIVEYVAWSFEFVLARLCRLHVALVSLGHHDMTHGAVAVTTPVLAHRTTGQLCYVPLAAVRTRLLPVDAHTRQHVSGRARTIWVDDIAILTKLSISLTLTFTGTGTKFTLELTPMMSSSNTATKTIGAHVAHPQKTWQTGDGVIVSVRQIQGHHLTPDFSTALIHDGVEVILGHDHQRYIAQHDLKLFPFWQSTRLVDGYPGPRHQSVCQSHLECNISADLLTPWRFLGSRHVRRQLSHTRHYRSSTAHDVLIF